ncbi:AzlC family ABC transporter permease [Archaeoglobus veneficus]|uniref:AzlC family protein n=1 Tax=Archaeoglobus veneficus (strain DSM 11195 / SNP6) TaxID=693661 RepID=F2KSH4_ARCVS|nr:AzlC family ABC transporter permease [Archaeoglobus veneficus]AEA46943.1 AzlC family protein [Archaeoglobus veneficus SNP6]
MNPETKTSSTWASTSLKDAFPIIVGYFSISVAFGVLAQNYMGWYAVLMSALVFAGASQFIALQMLIHKSAMPLIVLTTFLVNLRHILMSSYIATLYGKIKASTLKKAIVSFGITDETFAIASRRLRELPDANYHLSLNFLCYASWVSGTAVGLLFGNMIPSAVVDVLPFALTALFITLLVLSVRTRVDVFVAAFAGVVSTLLSFLPVGWNVMLAAILACVLGGVLEKWTR